MSGWRVVVVTGRSKLDLRYNSISIRRDNGTDFIHIGEVNTLILETTPLPTAFSSCLKRRQAKVCRYAPCSTDLETTRTTAH